MTVTTPRPTLELLPDSFKIPFFDEPKKQFCKVYNDGGHYIATPYIPQRVPKKKAKEDVQEIFDSLYAIAIKDGKNEHETKDFLFDNLCAFFENDEQTEIFIKEQIKRKAFNLYQRKKRFKRKAYLNAWTHFITITYSDKMLNEEDFRKKLRKCLCNFHTRRGWRYMGVFERAPETGRLHFHALLYVPACEMIGELTEKQDYSTRQHKMQKTIENSFFAEKFGRNDFKEITQGELRKGNTLAYLLKYIQKTGERIVYSRNIPEYIYKEIDQKDIASEMQDFVLKYVLFDDVIDWEKDVAHVTYEQIDIFALLRKTAPKEKKQRRKTAQKQGGLAVLPVSPLRFCRA